MSAGEVTGHCDPAFAPVRDALAELVDRGEELGASVAVDVDGELVVDVWGGWRDEGRSAPWERDTITNVWSTSKTVLSLAMLLLVERGLVDVDEAVSTYWPEFAAHGKERVLVRHVMSHTSGVSGWDAPFTASRMYDWADSTERLAAQEPWWAPGSASGYHASNQGHLLGEIVRRVSGKRYKEFVAEELAGPLGADFQIGASEADWGRIAPVVAPPPLPIDFAALDPASPMVKTFTGPAMDANDANTPAWRNADMGAINGHGNARSVARLLRVIARGGIAEGGPFLSPETLELVFREQSDGTDLVLGIPLRWGIGFALPEQVTLPYVPQGKVCYWGGWGGSLAVMDLDRRVTFSYVMNKMAPGIIGSDRSERYVRALEGCLQ